MSKYFNRELFDKIKEDFISGRLQQSNNIIRGKIELADKIIEEYPYNDESVKRKYYELGKKSFLNNECAVAIVNGGMATRFGGGVKGVVKVYDNKSFLQLKIENIRYICDKFKVKIYVFIMNSISTEKETIKHFEENNYFGYDKNYIIFFNQFYFKRINADGTIFKDENELYYGSGHGDFYFAFKKFIYKKFKNSSLKYIFYSNVDNAGAYIDPVIIGYHISNNNPITVELAKKISGDKGGVPVIVNGHPQIVEEFKFPSEFNQDLITVFNTASYIFSMSIFNESIELPFYVVSKKVNDTSVIQFERLTGDLTIYFKSNFLIINRGERFFPIKTQDDLENSREKIKQILSQKILE